MTARRLEKIIHNGDEYTLGEDAPRLGSFPGELLRAYQIAGGYTFTAPEPAGASQPFAAEIWVKGAGGGGSGYGLSGSVYTGGGGGGEGETVILRAQLIPGQNYVVTVGAGGSGSAGNTAAAGGGSSSFGELATAVGGGGGLNFVCGGLGGGYEADVIIGNSLQRLPGQSGAHGGVYGISSAPSRGGAGGGKNGGAGGWNLTFAEANGAPVDKGRCGCGGAGGTLNYNSGKGGGGGDGYVIIWRLQ